MASGWTESGVNWNSLSTQSPRDVIRELYIAVSERNYWYSFFGSGGYSTLDSLEKPDYDTSLRPRTKTQIEFILNKISKWLSSPKAYTLIGGDTDPLVDGVSGCLVDYNSGSQYEYTQYGDPANYVNEYNVATIGTGLQTGVGALQLGYSSYNSEEDGNTETLLGVDLSFIREYNSGNSQRFTFEMMNTVYKILTNLKYCRRGAYSYSQGKTAVNAIPYELWQLRWNSSEFEDVYFVQGLNQPANQSFSDARNHLYNNAFSSPITASVNYNNILGMGGSPPSIPFGLPERWGISNFGRNIFSYYEFTGYDGEKFRAGDFDLKSLIYSIGYKKTNTPSNWPFTGYFDIDLPDFYINRPVGHSIIDNNTRYLSNQSPPFEINVNKSGDYHAHSFGWFKTPDIPDSIESSTLPASGNFVEQSLPLISFDKEGFLKYYTEATN